ncbi:hypothetical protein [Croceitalea sp. P059]|uniref:hypothetical protein n=1 Tax=Croceitalea sp. P059 TaxID=3075601 RepID=UPI0028866176|nr:hypothetical protein [Croceitalea sp. P059]MDT0539360.1 hypothetical protein [Croceitalea sp. P059]
MIKIDKKFFKNLLMLFAITLSFNNAVGQISFEKAYYFDNDKNRIDGFIKNIDWESNPTEFQFKTDLDAQFVTLSIESVSGFEIENQFKYFRSKVLIDRSSNAMSQLGYERNPSLKEETLFLKILIEGEYVLYEYVDQSLRRFFYGKKDMIPELLVYKRYKQNDNIIGTNQLYKQQIKNTISCDIITLKRLNSLNYEKSSLKKFFKEINNCFGNSTVVEYDKEKTKFNFYLKAGISTNSIQTAIDQVYEVNGLIGYRFGAELEFVFPFNKNKWAAVIDPNYRLVSNETSTSNGVDVTVEFSSLEFPIGLRHYFFLNDKSKLFLEAYTNIEFGFNPSLTVGTDKRKGKAESNFSVGGGYNHKGKFSIGLRVETPQDILSNFVNIEGRFWSASLLVGLKL